jgi:hypothetical protein
LTAVLPYYDFVTIDKRLRIDEHRRGPTAVRLLVRLCTAVYAGRPRAGHRGCAKVRPDSYHGMVPSFAHAWRDRYADNKEAVLAAVAQDGLALEYAAETLRADKEVVLAAVAQHGRALLYAVPALAQHTALQQIAHLSRHWALELANQRLRLALLASASGRGCTIAALSADIIELVGAHITRDTVVRSLVARHHYWPACEPPPPTKKQKA